MGKLTRAAGLVSTPMAALPRGVVGSRGPTLIANLPGSPRGATESLAALLPVLRHALEQLAGYGSLIRKPVDDGRRSARERRGKFSRPPRRRATSGH